MSWRLIETCAGGAALTLHLTGAEDHLVPYQGGKWRYRRQLAQVLKERGFEGRPSSVCLIDSGPWGKAWQALGSGRAAVLNHLVSFSLQDPKAVYDNLHGQPASGDLYLFAAEFLFLQRLSHSGKAVGLSASGRWMSPGFNKTSAYGVAGTERFGAVAPMIPSLIRRLQTLDLPEIEALHERARCLGASETTAVYIDPPYSPAREVVAPVFPAPDIVAGSFDSPEPNATFHTRFFNRFWEPLRQLRMTLTEVLAPVFTKDEVLHAVIQTIMILVMDDLVWGQWTSELPFHDRSVLRDGLPIPAHIPVLPVAPSFSFPESSTSTHLTVFSRCFWHLSEFGKLYAHTTSMLSEAWLRANCTFLPAWASNLGPTDVAQVFERHVQSLRADRLTAARRYCRPARSPTPYPNGSLLREEVVALALAYAGSGATVLVSEAEPLEELTRLGWNVVEIQPPRTDGSPFKGKQSEYVTISPRG